MTQEIFGKKEEIWYLNKNGGNFQSADKNWETCNGSDALMKKRNNRRNYPAKKLLRCVIGTKIVSI